MFLTWLRIPDDDCPDSWTHYKDSCYYAKALPQSITWLEAEDQCEQTNGAYLASIMDEEEMAFINYLIIDTLGTKEAKTYIGQVFSFTNHNLYKEQSYSFPQQQIQRKFVVTSG